MLKNKLKKVTSMLLSIVMILTTFAMPIKGLDDEVVELNVSLIHLPNDSGNAALGHDSMDFMSSWSMPATNWFSAKYVIDDDPANQIAYCVTEGDL